MEDTISRLDALMETNVIKCKDTFSKFYNYGNHKSESESKIV